LIERLELFPVTAEVDGSPGENCLSIGGCDLAALASQYGTPLYLYDASTLDNSVQAYHQALSSSYSGQAGLTFAGKAFLCLAIAQWTQKHGLWLDCTGETELAIAAAAGVPRQHILVHGVNKSQADLQAALLQAGTLVVDNLVELQRLVQIYRAKQDPFPDLWLRLRPGLAVDTHVYTQTGQDDSKFGLSPAELTEAVQLCLAEGLPLVGLHFHQGSHFHDPAPLGPAIEGALNHIVTIRNSTGWIPQIFCPGGGWGVAYHQSELPHPSIETYITFVAGRLAQGCAQRGLPLPRLQFEPGRSLVARAGVAVYRVGAVKQSAGRRWLLVDGGLADNPRPALYGARYSALPVERPDRPAVGPAWLAGPFCESGDVLISALEMADIQPGELVAVPVSGAYQLSMGSNYNGARKPAVLWLDRGQAHLIQRRENLDDLLRRDLPLPE
jgi:diaminopimelate decarboxylase